MKKWIWYCDIPDGETWIYDTEKDALEDAERAGAEAFFLAPIEIGKPYEYVKKLVRV